MGLGDEGLPISLQIIGPRGADGAVLAAAELIEEAAPCCAVCLTCAATSGPTGRRSTSSRRPRSICWGSIAGCAASSTSTTTTRSPASTRRCSSRTRGRTASSTSIEDINNYLLSHKEVLDRIGDRGGLALFVFLDEETEQLASDAGFRVALPCAALRHRLDSKIVTTRLGNEAGVPSVPNRLGRASSYDEAARAGRRAGRRPGRADAVRGLRKTTFFIRGERDWAAPPATSWARSSRS